MMMPQMIAGAMGAAQAARPGAPAAPPAAGRKEVRPGMTFDEVRGLFGEPQGEVVFGNKARWTFADLTVIFEDGKVAEVKF
jgi:hypothetical protein